MDLAILRVLHILIDVTSASLGWGIGPSVQEGDGGELGLLPEERSRSGPPPRRTRGPRLGHRRAALHRLLDLEHEPQILRNGLTAESLGGSATDAAKFCLS